MKKFKKLTVPAGGEKIEVVKKQLKVPDQPIIPFIEGDGIGQDITPVSLKVSLRQVLNLYACIRPVKYIPGVPAPVKHPEDVDLVIFRENTEDVYAGFEWAKGLKETKKLISFLNKNLKTKIRLDSGIGIKPISVTGTKRLVRKAIQFALEHNRPSE